MKDLKENWRWILSGSLCGWGDVAIKLFGLVIYLWVPTDIRISRLKRREIERFGETDLGPGGKMYKHHRAFIGWAKEYDDGGLDMRSKARHENWLEKVDCDIIRYEGEKSFDEIMEGLTTECT
ncbi:MAG TPA: hypothetical protein ENI27_02470 [bacterium]|nr:hypothetical protein [bacterium]